MPIGLFKPKRKATEKPCLRCGYSLRHNIDAKRCPECGLDVWLTLSLNDSLELSNPAWLRAVLFGSTLLAVANILLFLGVLLVIVINVLPSSMKAPALVFRLLWGSRPILELVAGAYLVVAGLGMFCRAFEEGRYPDRVRGVRISSGMAGMLSVAVGFWFFVGYIVGAFGPPVFLSMLGTHALAAIELGYAASLSRRIPSRKTRQVAYLALCAIALSAAAILLNGSYYRYLFLFNPWSKQVFLWTLLLLIYPPMVIGIHLRIAHAFRRAIPVARKEWGSGEVGHDG